jgi:regulator of Ty1 transposition protein 109
MALNRRLKLEERLATALPAECRFIIHHLSTPPTPCRAIFAAPPGEQPDDTYCESHFLSVSIDSGGDGTQLQVFAIEVLIYTTEILTTLFVSKADSTGYLHLLKLPKGTPSPLKIISTTFLQYLIEERRRPDRRLVLSLFARAQNQYLFPGSVENIHKHVLDDRGLIKWWCKVVDPILGTFQDHSEVPVHKPHGITRNGQEIKSHGFLRVPGCDKYETRGFLPKREDGRVDEGQWSMTDPLLMLGKPPSLPERCFIPRFPDDPKARFVYQLDDELPDAEIQPLQPQAEENTPEKQNTGRWRSVQSLEAFWEMMSFRQECSSGRLVGFLWATFQPATLYGAHKSMDAEGDTHKATKSDLPTLFDSQHLEASRPPPQSPLRSNPVPEAHSRSQAPPMPTSKQSPNSTPVKSNGVRTLPEWTISEETKDFYWPTSSRGELVMPSKHYQRVGNLLLRLDYADQAIAEESTKKWIDDVAKRAGAKHWGYPVVGSLAKVDATGDMNPRKRAAEGDIAVTAVQANGINTLSTGLVRKKAKVANIPGPTLNQKAERNGT